MKYIIDHDFHIHSLYSPCSRDPEQTSERILRYGIENGYKHLALTNHMWDSAVKGNYGDPKEQTVEYISQALPLPQSETTSLHFGCETDMDINYVLGISKEAFERFEIVLISTTHLHLEGYTIKKNATLNERAQVYIKRLEKVLDNDFIDFKKVGITHPASTHASPENPFNELFELIDKDDLRRVFSAIAQKGAGVEINSGDFNFEKKSKAHIDAILELYGILRECGCKFYMGSDAHHPRSFERAQKSFETAVSELGLKEEEKFKIW